MDRMVLEVALTTAPFRVSVPDVTTLLPILNTLPLSEVTSIAPIERLAVPILIPAVVAVPALLNWAILEVVQAFDAVDGDQFPEVYQAVAAPVFIQGMMIFAEGTNSPVDKIIALKLFVPLLNTICESCCVVKPEAFEPKKIFPPVPVVPL